MADQTWQRVVIVESPYNAPTPAGVLVNRAYLDLCLLDCLNRNEVPIASHKLYTDCLDDKIPEQRKKAMAAGFELHKIADAQVRYMDLGTSGGMIAGLATWLELHGNSRPSEERYLPAELMAQFGYTKQRILIEAHLENR